MGRLRRDPIGVAGVSAALARGDVTPFRAYREYAERFNQCRRNCTVQKSACSPLRLEVVKVFVGRGSRRRNFGPDFCVRKERPAPGPKNLGHAAIRRILAATLSGVASLFLVDPPIARRGRKC